MTKLVLISDIHLHNWESFATTLPGGRNSRLQHTLDALKQVGDFCEKESVDLLVCLGDVFHSRTKIDVDVYSAGWEAFRLLSTKVRELIVLVGNHDQGSRDGHVHSLTPFSEFATVVDLPLLCTFDGLRLAFHPFTTDVVAWKLFAKMLPPVDYFFFHQGVTEATVGGFDISVKAELSLAEVPTRKARWAFAGHYHKRQMLGPNCGFVGSLVQNNFGERCEEKGFLFIENGQPRFVPTFAPSFFQFENSEEARRAIEEKHADPDYDYIRVRCTAADAAFWQRTYSQVQTEIVAVVQTEERRVDEAAVSNDEALLGAYIKQSSAQGLDPERLLSLGLDLLSGDA